MEEQLDEPDADGATKGLDFQPARFTAALGLPSGDPQQLTDAAFAVRQEYRDSSRWKRLNCKKVSLFAERDRGTVYVVHVGKSVDFDWTWEGATAFCPQAVTEDARLPLHVYEEAAFDIGVVWSGEIVEVDEQHGCLFIALDDPEAQPTAGPFFVRPFEFLSVLNAIYNEAEFAEVRAHIPDRLKAAEGDVYPTVVQAAQAGLPHLHAWWQHSWSILWGPPGTGKTWTTGQQIAHVLNDPTERMLVVSTTNKATDAVAVALGEAAQTINPNELNSESLLRIGKGGSFQSFVSRQLTSMLAGTESEVLSQMDALARQLPLFDSWEEKALTRKQIGELQTSGRDNSLRIFVDPSKRAVMATAFKAMSLLKNPLIRSMIENGEAPFTTLFIDEAGLISRTAVAALSLLAARRVVLVGDSKQLAPISRISRVLPARQQTWLASSGLSHLEQTSDVPSGVHLLSEQHRMHPDVCQVVSNYQYNGALSTAPTRAQQTTRLSPFIANQSRAIWYTLDEEECELADIRACRGPGNKSWVRSVTKTVLQKLFSDTSVRQANGLFISPFRAQAQAVNEWLAEWRIDSWEASTVHSQQGAEADIVVFDTVNAGSHSWGIVEWKRLVNVALSRAKEAVIVLASRSEMEEPYLRPLMRQLKPMVLEPAGDAFRWRELTHHTTLHSTAVVEHKTTYGLSQTAKQTAHTTTALKHTMGEQFAARKSMKPVLSQEQQRLSNLELDGKPRLVRGVAGSGKSVVLCNWLAKTAMRLRGKKNVRIWAVYANQSLRKLLCDSIDSAWHSLNQGQLFEPQPFPWEMVELLHVKDVLTGLLASAQLSMEPFEFDYDRAAEAFLKRPDAHTLLPRCSALFIDEAQDMGPSTLRLLLSVVEQTDTADINSRSAHIFYDDAQNVYDTKIPKWSEFGLDLRGRSTIMRESFRSTGPITELAINVLHRLCGSSGRYDTQELITLGLLTPTRRNHEEWLTASFSLSDGPKPIYHSFGTRTDEMSILATHLKHLIEVERISPTDICVIYNGAARRILTAYLGPQLAKIGVELSFQTNRTFERKSNTLLATTAHSYKGYESEVVVIPCVDLFVAPGGKLLAHSLYVAMTRARSLLAIYGINSGSAASRQLTTTLAACIDSQGKTPAIDIASEGLT
jgi:superfamily I DNA/RNA helicase